MRQRPQPASSLLAEEQPLDEQEQDAVLAELEQQQATTMWLFRLLFGVGAAALATFFVYAAWQQQAAPWQVRYTGELRTVTSQGGSVAALALQGAGLAAAAAALLAGLPGRGARARSCLPAPRHTWLLLAAAAAVTAGAGAYWAVALHANVRKWGRANGFHPELMWLPAGPVAYCLLCLYFTHSLSTTSQELQKLQRLRYRFKKV
jgi:hypothetical protein